MKEATLKEDLIDKIKHADNDQVRDIYGLVTNYFNEQGAEDEWESLSEYHKERIMKSIAEADAGLGIPVKDVIDRVNKKYGLTG
jgi:hypothetical protein